MDHNPYGAEDADLAILAIAAFVAALAQDPRVTVAYASWCDRANQRFEALPCDAASWERHALIAAGMWTNPDGQLAQIETLVSHDLGLTYAWLAPTLLKVFRACFIQAAVEFSQPGIDGTRHPNETRDDYARRLLRATRPPAGRRRPKGGGRHIVRDVTWLYRARVKQPPDTIRRLAGEYARETRRTTDARSVVQTGIKRAGRLLAGISLIPLTIPQAALIPLIRRRQNRRRGGHGDPA